MKKAYLAGPEVFLADAVDIARAKQALCAAYGFAGLAPLDGEVTASGGPDALAGAIYDKNVRMIRGSDLVIANLTPFRGLVMDPGTAFEIGFACALGLPVFGYANIEANHFRRVADAGPLRPRPGRPEVREDTTGLAVEDFGLFENLMIDVPIRRVAGAVETGTVPPERLYGDLSVFERCLARAAATLASG